VDEDPEGVRRGFKGKIPKTLGFLKKQNFGFFF
jgi:hypothetical protein